MKLQEAMTKSVETIEPMATIQSAARLMKSSRVGMLPVVGPGHRPVGVITDRDITIRATARGMPPETPVREAMTSTLHTLQPEQDLQTAIDLMKEAKIGRVLVCNAEGHLQGVLSLKDAEVLCNGGQHTAEVSKVLADRTNTNTQRVLGANSTPLV